MSEQRLIDPLERTLGLLAAVVLGAMVVVTTLDVSGRTLFDAPISGAYELTQLGMAILVFAALPLVTARDEQITIDVLERYYPPRLKRVFRAVVAVLAIVIIGFFGWQAWIYADFMQRVGEVTANLRLSVAPMAYFVSAMWWLTAAVVLALWWTVGRHRRD